MKLNGVFRAWVTTNGAFGAPLTNCAPSEMNWSFSSQTTSDLALP
jgi:hypothetical protein